MATSAIAAHRVARVRMRGEKYVRISSFHCDTNRRNGVVPETKKPGFGTEQPGPKWGRLTGTANNDSESGLARQLSGTFSNQWAIFTFHPSSEEMACCSRELASGSPWTRKVLFGLFLNVLSQRRSSSV